MAQGKNAYEHCSEQIFSLFLLKVQTRPERGSSGSRGPRSAHVSRSRRMGRANPSQDGARLGYLKTFAGTKKLWGYVS